MYKAFLTVFRTPGGELVPRNDHQNVPCDAILGTHIDATMRSYQLKNGSTMIGRLWPLNLAENRVSRTHGEINFSETAGILTLTPRSMNPLFIKTLAIRTRVNSQEAADTQSLPMLRTNSQVTPSSSQDSNNTSLTKPPLGPPSSSSSQNPSQTPHPSQTHQNFGFSTPIGSPMKKQMPSTPILPQANKRQLSELSSIKPVTGAAGFGINNPHPSNVAHLLRVSSQVQTGGGFQIRGIVDDDSQRPNASQTQYTPPAPPAALSQNDPSYHLPSKPHSTPEEAVIATPFSADASTTKTSSQPSVDPSDIGEVEKATAWSTLKPDHPYIVRYGEPGIMLVSFLGTFGTIPGPIFQVHIVKVGGDSLDSNESTIINSQESTQTQIVLPSLDDALFAVPALPKPKIPASTTTQTSSAFVTPSIDSSKRQEFASPSTSPGSKTTAPGITPDDPTDTRPRVKASLPPRTSPSASVQHPPMGYSPIRKVDLSNIDDIELDSTPNRKRKVMADVALEAGVEASGPLGEIRMGDDGVVSKKRKEQEMVVEGNHEIAEMQKPDLTVIPHTAPAQEQANKVKSKPAVKARQLFDADDDDDGEDNMDESESADEEEVEDRVVAPHDMVVEPKEHLKMAEKDEFAVTQRKSSRLATARGSSKTQISRDSADNDASLFTPPRPRRRASSKVKISPSSPPGLSAQPSLMDVVEPSQPLPSLTARESHAYMDMDDSYQMKRKGSKNRRYSDPSQDISLRSAPSSMKGVTEYHSEPSGHVGMELSTEHGAEGGEGMAVVTSPPPPHFEPPQVVYEVNPIAPLYDPEPPVTYEASRTPIGRLGVGSGQGSLQRADTLTPSIDITQLRVIQTIGSGSCGEVYKATWLGLTVAVKKVFRSLIHENALKEFQAECNIMKRLRHPNIVLFLGITKSGEDDSASNGAMNGMADAGSIKLGQSNALLFSDSLMCLVTEFMPLGSLHDVLMNPKTSVDLMAILKMATDAAMGVNYLHQFSPPIIHRDLKSHNLLVGDNFMVKVTDFGLAKLTTSRDDAHNTFCGTLPWAAPEVLSGAGYTVKADVYSFGVVLWELLTRQEPYKGLHKPDIIVGVVNNNLRPPLFPDMEPLVVELIEACWAQNPEDRPEFQQIVDRLTEVTDYLYSLHQQRKALGPSSMASHGGELHYGSKWLAEHAPGTLDHHQQVALSQAAAQAGAAPDSTAMLTELEHGVGIHQGQLGVAGPIDSAGAGHGSSPSHSGRISNVSSTEAILKNQREALESMNAALEAGDMAQVCAAMAQMKAAVESASRFPAFVVSNDSGTSAHQHQNGGASGPSSQHNSTASLNSSKKIGHSWTLDLNELTSIAKLPEEPSPSFSNRGQIGKPGDNNQSSLTLSGTTNVMAHSEPEEQKACTAWHGEFRGQDVLVRVWHDALEASEVAEFHKQLNILSSVRSPRIAIFYGCVLEPRLLMVTEFTPNPSLYSLMIADPTTVIFDWDIVMTVALEIAKAISALHQWKPSIVHRDIQSSKFIVDQRTWTVKMNDLGLARFNNGSNQSTLAKMKGNFLYTAPETYSGTAYSIQSDIYSFGIVLWELVTRCVAGQYVMPFSECTNIKFEFQLVLQISKDNIRPSLHPDTPEPLSQLITSCWNADPLQRPAITDVVDQLERLRELYLQETQKQRQDMPAAM